MFLTKVIKILFFTVNKYLNLRNILYVEFSKLCLLF